MLSKIVLKTSVRMAMVVAAGLINLFCANRVTIGKALAVTLNQIHKTVGPGTLFTIGVTTDNNHIMLGSMSKVRGSALHHCIDSAANEINTDAI